jgi:DNA-binding IclR family transcriptional regulator
MNNTLINGLSLLLTVAKNPDDQGITELSYITGLPKSHVHRLLKSLAEAQYLEKDQQSRYKISVGALRLGSELLRNIPIRSMELKVLP